MLSLYEAYVICKQKYPDTEFKKFAEDLGDVFIFTEIVKKTYTHKKGKLGFLENLMIAIGPTFASPWVMVNKTTGEVSSCIAGRGYFERLNKIPESERKKIRVSLDKVIKAYNKSHK